MIVLNRSHKTEDGIERSTIKHSVLKNGPVGFQACLLEFFVVAGGGGSDHATTPPPPPLPVATLIREEESMLFVTKTHILGWI